MKKVVALIPCRKNSKGIPNKNMINFSGKPLIYWTLKSLKDSKIIDDVYVTSDSDRILNYSKKFKVKTIKRPNKLATSKSMSENAIMHAIKKIKINYDYIVFAQVTSPLRPKNIFDKSLKHFFKNKFDSLFSSTKVKNNFLWKMKGIKLNPNYNIKHRKMRQQINNIYCENGSFYIFSKKGFLKNKNRLFGKIGTYELDKVYASDIDEIIDLKLCELIKKNLIKKNV